MRHSRSTFSGCLRCLRCLTPVPGIVSAVPTLGWLGRRRCRKINADFAGFWHCPLSRLILVRPTGFSCFYSVFFFSQKEDEGVAGDAEDAGWLSTGLPNGSGG